MDSKVGNILAYSLTMLVAVEQAIPQAGLGATKKQVVLNGIETALKATSAVSAAGDQPEIAAMTGLASAFIDETVALLTRAKAGPFAAKLPAPAAAA